jgi:hypothetical protein
MLSAILSSPKLLAAIGFLMVLAFAGVQTARLQNAKMGELAARAQLATLKVQEAAAAALSARKAQEAAQASKAVQTASEAQQTHIQYVTRIIHDQIKVALPASADPLLSHGFVRLYDAAALGVPPAAPASAGADAAASPYRASDALDSINTNYASCRIDQGNLAAWQAWYAKVR